MAKTWMRDAVEQYYQYRTAMKVAKHTIACDRVTLGRLLEVTGGDILVESVRADHIDRTMINLGQTNSERSLVNHHNNLNSFFKYCARSKLMPRYNDPMDGRKPPSFQVEERRRLHVTQFPVALDAAPNARDRGFIAAGLYVLGRGGELSNFRVGDVNFPMQRIKMNVSKVRGRKRMSTDLMPITSEFDTELRQWLMAYQDHCGYLDPSWYLFPRLSRPKWLPEAAGRKAGFNAASQVLVPNLRIMKPHDIARRNLLKIGFITEDDRGEGMHAFRRAGARARFDALRGLGYDGALRQVQALLHHATTAMTEHYIGLDLDKLERDEALMGQMMYPQLQAENLVNLNEHRVDTIDERDWHADLPGFKIRRAS
jgi:integrase